MSLGIGLGGFAQGLGRGYGLGQEMSQDRDKRKKRKALDTINTDTKAAFQAQGGNPNDGTAMLNFYQQYALPKTMAELIGQGEHEKAKSLAEWSEAANTQKAIKLMGAGIIAGQAGDMKGALTKFVEAGRIQGYGGDYQLTDPEEIAGGGMRVKATGPDGKEHVIDFKTPDEVAQFGMTYGNPLAAYEAAQAGRSEAAKTEKDLAVDRAKLGNRTEDDLMRRDLGLGENKDEETLGIRKQAHDELKDTNEWFDASPDEQKQMLEDRIREIAGNRRAAAPGLGGGPTGEGQPTSPSRTPSAPAARQPVIVDSATGARVDQAAPAAAAPAPAPASTQAPRRTARRTPGSGTARGRKSPQRPVIINGTDVVDAESGEVVGQVAAPQGGQAPAAAGSGGKPVGPMAEGYADLTRNALGAVGISVPARSEGNTTPQTNALYKRLVAEAANKLAEGGNLNAIRFALRRAGVPLEMWPETLRPR